MGDTDRDMDGRFFLCWITLKMVCEVYEIFIQCMGMVNYTSYWCLGTVSVCYNTSTDIFEKIGICAGLYHSIVVSIYRGVGRKNRD